MNVAVAPFVLLLLLLVVLIAYLRSDPGRAFRQGDRHVSMAALIGLIIALGLGLSLRQTDPADVADLRPRPEALEADLASRALARGEGFVFPYEDRAYPPRVGVGFPLLVAAARLGTGAIDTPGVGAWASWFLGGAVIALAFFLALEIGGPRAAVAAAFLTALSPFQVYHARQPVGDMAALAFLLAALTLCVRALRRGRVSPARAFLLAFLVAFGTTIRGATALLLPLVAYVVLALVPNGGKRRGMAFAALALGLLAGLGPQLVVQWTQHGSPWRTGDAFWQTAAPGADPAGGSEANGHAGIHARSPDDLRAYARLLVPFDSFADDRARLERMAEPRPETTREERRARRKERIHPYELVERRFDVEPNHLYPFFVLLLAVIGFGLSSQEEEMRTVRRATALTLIAAVLFVTLYAIYPHREARSLLPVQVLVLVFAARAFTARRRPMRIGVWVLAIYALWSALPELSRATRTPQGDPPFGRSHEERTLLTAIDARLPREPVALLLHTHGNLFEECLLAADRRWIPLALDEHARAIDTLDLRARAPRRAEGDERLAQLATYRREALEWSPSTDELLARLEAGTLSGATFDERDRDWLLQHLESLAPVPFPATTRLIQDTRTLLYDDPSPAAIDAHLERCREVSLGALARRISTLCAAAQAEGRALYYADLSRFALGPVGREIDRMLREEERRRHLHLATLDEAAGGTSEPGDPTQRAARDERVGFTPGAFVLPEAAAVDGSSRWRIERPGFPKDDPDRTLSLYVFRPANPAD